MGIIETDVWIGHIAQRLVRSNKKFAIGRVRGKVTSLDKLVSFWNQRDFDYEYGEGFRGKWAEFGSGDF